MKIRRATVADAPAMARLIWAAFGARPTLDPPAPALAETPDSVAAEITARGGLVARDDGAGAPVAPGSAGRGGLVARDDGPVVGSLLFGTGPGLRLTRVCTDPAARHHGIAAALVEEAEWLAARRGIGLLSLVARRELTENVTFWTSLGYDPLPPELFPAADRLPHNLHLGKASPRRVRVDSADQMRALGGRLARSLRTGDLVLLTGPLGAGKTTFTQGLGAGLGVAGSITSPTFVIAREHRGPTPLVHVDGYRLNGPAELADLDLESPAAAAVTVVEWGRGLAEGLAAERLEIEIGVPPADDARWSAAADGEEPRTVTIRARGGGWAQRGLVDAV